MYPASNDFHQAVKNGADQMPLLIFGNTVFTAEDIDVNNGIRFNDYFNMEEDLSIGQALSNELSFTLFNDNGHLNDYEFGEFVATIGVKIGTDQFSSDGHIYAESGDNVYIGYSTSPYLKINNAAPTTQPDGPVRNIIVYDGYAYVFTATGYKVYSESTGQAVARTVSTFMAYKGKHLKRQFGAVYNKATRILKIYRSNVEETYEFVPLGTFIADRPNVPTTHTVDFYCNDRMMKFEKDMPDDETLGITWPTTIGTLYTKMCNYLDVPYETATFINSDGVIAKRPNEFDSATMRQVLAWIAEAAGSNAKFNRDGALRLEWLKTTTVTLDEHDYKTFEPYWYETQTVDKLYNRTQGDNDLEYGSGDAGYLILDNPLLKGVS